MEVSPAEHLIETQDSATASRLSTIAKLKKLMIFCTIFMLIELVGGIWSNSIAVISDSLHMVIDLLGYGVQLYSAKLALQPRSQAYSFGLYRAESIGGFLNCFFIWIMTIYLLYEAGMRLYHPPEYFNSGIMLLASFLGVVMNFAMSVVLVGFGNILRMVRVLNRPDESDMTENDFNLKTTIAHIQGDIIYSVGVLISAIVITLFPSMRYFDSLCTLLFSLVVVDITIPIFTDSMRFIMEGTPKGELSRLEHHRIRA